MLVMLKMHFVVVMAMILMVIVYGYTIILTCHMVDVVLFLDIIF